MGTAFTANILIDFSAIVLRSIIHVGMTDSIPSEQPCAKFASNAGLRIVDYLSNSLTEKVRNFLNKEKTMQERLNAIVQTSFDEMNEKYESRFTNIPADLMKANPDVKVKEDFRRYVWKWIMKKNKETVPQVNQDTVNHFVNDFYQAVNDKIDQDDELKVHLATLRTEEGVRTIQAEIEKLKKDRTSTTLISQGIDEDDIEMAEENLKEQLAFLEEKKSGNRIDIQGQDNDVEDNEQRGKNNEIGIKGNNNTVKGNKQISM